MHRIRTLLTLFVLVGLLAPASDAWASKTLGVALAWELSEKLKGQQISSLPEAEPISPPPGGAIGGGNRRKKKQSSRKRKSCDRVCFNFFLILRCKQLYVIE